jgi:WD40 repeat protein
MPPSETSRVFISYARKDGADLAQRLQSDLGKEGFDAWLDKQRIEGGTSWTDTIEQAIDGADYLLALMTQGSYVSEICRAEQLRSLRKGKCVIPLLAQQSSDIPLHLEAKNYRDFSAGSKYADSFNELLTDLQDRNGVVLREEFRATSYVTVPPLPVNFVERPEAVAAVRNALMAEDGGRHVALTALQGMGGIGKTVLAQALCCDEVVQQAFPDGVIWVTIGKEAQFDPLTRMKELARALGDHPSKYDNLLAAKNQYRTKLKEKAALIVVDDVWRSSDLEPFLAENSPRSRLLFTTRDASIAAGVGAREHLAELPSDQKSREVLARWAGMEADKLPPIAGELVAECGRLPLALSMVGAMVRGKAAAYWKTVLEDLRDANLDEIKAHFPDYPYTDVLRALQVSVDALDKTARERYLALAILPEEMSAAPQVQQCIWGVDEGKAVRTAEQFISLSLAQRGGTDGSIKLHDLQLDYVRAQWPQRHRESLELIHGAMRLSSQVIAKDPGQFAAQMVGRLLPFNKAFKAYHFTEKLAKNTQAPWLRSLRPALHPPRAPLICSISGVSGKVISLAVTPNAERVVSASDDESLKVWDVASGTELFTLKGHLGKVNAVVTTPDGHRLVSASDDGTLKVWDLASGVELFTLEGHSDKVNAVVVTPDGHRVVSGSGDGTLKVWSVGAKRNLRTLEGHSDSVAALAMTSDGRAVSASSTELKAWDVDNGCELLTIACHSDEGHAVELPGPRAVSVLYEPGHMLKVWDPANAREPYTVYGPSNITLALAKWLDQDRVVSASINQELEMWTLASGGELETYDSYERFDNVLAVTWDGRRAVSSSYGRTLKGWDLANAREYRSLEGHPHRATAVALTPDGCRAVSASYHDETLRVWDLASAPKLSTIKRHTAEVLAVRVTPDGLRAVSASADNTLKTWDLAKKARPRTLSGHSDRVFALAMTAKGKRAISGSYDATLAVWDLRSGRKLHRLEGHSDLILGLAVTPDGKRAVSACVDWILKVWDLTSGRELHTLKGYRDPPVSTLEKAWPLAVTPDSRYALAAADHHTLKLWDLIRGRGVRTFSVHLDTTALAITQDGKRAVSGSLDGTLKVWNLISGRELRTLSGHSSLITALAAVPNSQRVLSASTDRTLKLWDLAKWCEIRSFEGHSGEVTAVALSGDGRRAISASDDRTLKVWDLGTGKCIATFTADEKVACCAFSDRLNMILAGDAGGQVHFLRLEEPKSKD